MPLFNNKLKLVGECNRCGLCCTVSWNGRTLKCHNLDVRGPIGLGAPDGAFCRAYRQRYPGMPIMLYDDNGSIQALGACAHNSEIEPEVIGPWIGKGCSLRLVEDGNDR
jgi:hypothetical protein